MFCLPYRADWIHLVYGSVAFVKILVRKAEDDGVDYGAFFAGEQGPVIAPRWDEMNGQQGTDIRRRPHSSHRSALILPNNSMLSPSSAVAQRYSVEGAGMGRVLVGQINVRQGRFEKIFFFEG